MTATSADYAWFTREFPDLAQAYCLTLVHGVTPGQLLDRLGATPDGVTTGVTGAGGLIAAAYDAWDEHELDLFYLAATQLGDGWTLALEPNGYLGSSQQVIVPLSAGTTVVSHFRNVNAVDHFHWVVDGDVRVTFEPLFPTQRSGSTPDALLPAMAAAGFNLDPDSSSINGHTAAAFALAEHLTGVRVTPELLETAPFTHGLVPDPFH